jgi:hypothetical protein
MMADSPLSELLGKIASLWDNQIKLCEEAKARDFGDAADEIMRYVGKQYHRVEVRDAIPLEDMPADYVTVVNYTQLFVDTLTPYVFARVPNRLVQPGRPQIPPELENAVPEIVSMQEGQRKKDTMLSYELQAALQWFPKVYGLTEEGEVSVREALAKGRGCLWTEMVDGPVDDVPGSMADSVDNLLIDSDCRKLREAGFIIRKRQQVSWKIASLWSEDVKNIRANAQTAMSRASASANHDTTNNSDLATYYEIWSVMGIGDKLVNAPDDMLSDGALATAFEQIGLYVHFAIMPGVDHPLGMDSEKINTFAENPAALLQELKGLLAWPIATYGNTTNPWPVKCIDFKPQVGCPWPRPILEPALPLLRFIDTIYQGLMVRAEKIGQIVTVTSQALEEAVKTALKGREQMPVVAISEADVGKALKEYLDFIQFPETNKDVFTILQLADSAFREMTGLDESWAGASPQTQERSAKASGIRQAGLSRRPDEYADKVEAWGSEVSEGEAIAARLLLSAETVSFLFGEKIMDPVTGKEAEGDIPNPVYGALTSFWMNEESGVTTNDPWIAAAECEYTIEAGSGRRRNKQLQQENAQQLYTMLGQQVFSICTSMQDYEPYLALVRMVGDAYEMPTEPVIASVREALQKFVAAQQAAQQQQVGPDGQPMPPQQGGQGGSPTPLPGANVLPASYMGAAGGARAMHLPPPPGTT